MMVATLKVEEEERKQVGVDGGAGGQQGALAISKRTDGQWTSNLILKLID